MIPEIDTKPTIHREFDNETIDESLRTWTIKHRKHDRRWGFDTVGMSGWPWVKRSMGRSTSTSLAGTLILLLNLPYASTFASKAAFLLHNYAINMISVSTPTIGAGALHLNKRHRWDAVDACGEILKKPLTHVHVQCQSLCMANGVPARCGHIRSAMVK